MMKTPRDIEQNFDLRLIQDALVSISNRANETHDFMFNTLPKQMDNIAELSARRALQLHEASCEARKAYPGMSAKIAEDSRVVDLLASGKELTSKQRKYNARNSDGTVSISPTGIRFRLPRWAMNIAVGVGILAAAVGVAMSARSFVVDQKPSSREVDTEKQPALLSSARR